MKLEKVQTFKIDNAESKQFHRIVLLNSGICVGLYSQNDSDSVFLQWFSEGEIVNTKIELIKYEVFETPTMFHFDNYVGIYSSNYNFIILYSEKEKNKAIKIQIENKLPEIKFPNFTKPLANYKYAGNTDSNIVPLLFTDSGQLPVYEADLFIDVENNQAKWMNLKYWNNKTEISLIIDSFERPSKKPFTILHALNTKNKAYTFGIGDKDGGYLKPGMDYSDLILWNETGAIIDILFSLGKLYKNHNKGGKECLFTSSCKYAILTPVFKSDDWKNKQKLFDLENKKIIDIEIPKEFLNNRIIDHNKEYFLLVDNYINLIFAKRKEITICKIQQSYS